MVSSGGTTPTDELRMLRARAYGPGADIHEDAAALDRLRALEEEAFLVDEPATKEVAAADEASPETAAVESEPEPEPVDAEPPSSRRTLVPATRRGRIAVAAACLAIVVAVTAGVTTAVVRTVQADPRTIATLAVDPTIELGEAFGGFTDPTQPVVAYEDFHGLTPIVVPGWAGVAGDCLLITPTSGLDTFANGWSSVGGMNCEVGSFASGVQFIVSDAYGVPVEFRDRFPEGTALRFELDGASVVLLDGSTD